MSCIEATLEFAGTCYQTEPSNEETALTRSRRTEKLPSCSTEPKQCKLEDGENCEGFDAEPSHEREVASNGSERHLRQTLTEVREEKLTADTFVLTDLTTSNNSLIIVIPFFTILLGFCRNIREARLKYLTCRTVTLSTAKGKVDVKLRIYPNGVGDAADTHLSVYCCLSTSKNNKNKDYLASWFLKGQQGSVETYRKTYRMKSEEWRGCRHFMSHDKLSPYLSDSDSLTVGLMLTET